MRVALGCDHAGFPLKQDIRDLIERFGARVIDCGTHSAESVDYPDHAAAVAGAVRDGVADRGIILCGSGVGACVVANKVEGVRASVCHDTYSAAQGVEHDDMNVLCLGGRIIGPALLPDLVNAFLGAEFSNQERHLRRLQKLLQVERGEWPESIAEVDEE